MSSQIPLNELANEIKARYTSDAANAENVIEAYLEERLKGLPAEEQLTVLEEVATHFKGVGPQISSCPQLGPETRSRLCSLLLGRGISETGGSSEELMERLAQSINTIFDTLNQLVKVIHTTLLGAAPELETIRHVIGSELEGESRSDSLEGYLDQIKKAFLVAHEAFKQSTNTKLNEIIVELDPDRIAATVDAGLKFGPLRKAELFDVYQEKFQKLKKWFESGRFMEDLLREFERDCRKLYVEKGGVM
jgi:hypothetical protein